MSRSMLEPWGGEYIFVRSAAAFKQWWASNPGAMTYWCACWIEQRSLGTATQYLILNLAKLSFQHLDWGALRVKQMLAAAVMRLKAESQDTSLQQAISRVLGIYPEMRELCNSWDHIYVQTEGLRTGSRPPAWTENVSERGDLQAGVWFIGCAMKSASALAVHLPCQIRNCFCCYPEPRTSKSSQNKRVPFYIILQDLIDFILSLLTSGSLESPWF